MKIGSDGFWTQGCSLSDGSRVWCKAEWMVWHSDRMYRLQRLLLVIFQFTESEQWGISDFKSIWVCPRFGKAEKDSLSHWTLDAHLTDRMTEEEEGIVAKDGGQMMGRIGCMVERQKWKWWKESWMGDVINETYYEQYLWTLEDSAVLLV